MRKLSIPILLALAVAFSPLVGFGANDVTLTALDLSVNGATLGVTSGGTMDQIVVGATSFSTTMSAGSSIKVTSNARRKLTVSPSNMASNETCTSSESSATIGSSPTATPVVVTVEVSSNTCSGAGSSGTGSSGGGGGVVGVTTSSPSPTPAPVLATSTPISPAAPITPADAATIVAAANAALTDGAQALTAAGLSVSALFTKNLGPGVTNSDVKRLQQLLNSASDTMIAVSGVGSPGNESDFYGALTVKAVQKFQIKYGLIAEGTPSTTGFGALGPKTRAAVEMYLGKNMIAPTEGTLAVASELLENASTSRASLIVYLTNALSKGKMHSDVLALQRVLNSDPETQIAVSGVGSPGNETDYYGGMTEKAVQKFQLKYSIASAKDTGFGSVGPKTRAKINEMFGQMESIRTEMMTSAPMSSPTGSAADDIQGQINAALKKVSELQLQVSGQLTVPVPPPTPAVSNDAAEIQKQIDDAMKKIQEISLQIKAGY